MPPAPEQGVGVPVEVFRQPLHELELRLAGGPISPGRRYLGDLHARSVCLGGQLESQLESASAFDPQLVNQRRVVEAEIVGRVVGWEPGQQPER